ncbi:hypothetical protein GGX14DRAFT_406807 [Mycena pura]|uniref:Uncharacterized protein n=1 Tax=Mycena pura TaxID=153505 RepID=A0AAD6Y2V4_9AGAR|nr:hypothetical protein GGX14DRAFT_406807 [Mycena pura]
MLTCRSYHLTGAGGAAQELADVSDWINIARSSPFNNSLKSVTQAIQMILGDLVLIITPSFILYLGSVAISIKLIEVEASLDHAKNTSNSSVIAPWWIAFFGITVVQNIWTTGLLIWPIWRVEHESAKYRVTGIGNSQPQLRIVIRIIAESGCAYTVTERMYECSGKVTNLAGNNRIFASVFTLNSFGSNRQIVAEPREYGSFNLMRAETGRSPAGIESFSGPSGILRTSGSPLIAGGLCGSNLSYPISDVTLQAAGIAFNAIIMRSASRRDEQFATFDTNSRFPAEGGLEFAWGPNRSGKTTSLDDGHIGTLNLTV